LHHRRRGPRWRAEKLNLDIAVDLLATPAGKYLLDGAYTDTITVRPTISADLRSLF
jgi:hypothetical protein